MGANGDALIPAGNCVAAVPTEHGEASGTLTPLAATAGLTSLVATAGLTSLVATAGISRRWLRRACHHGASGAGRAGQRRDRDLARDSRDDVSRSDGPAVAIVSATASLLRNVSPRLSLNPVNGCPKSRGPTPQIRPDGARSNPSTGVAAPTSGVVQIRESIPGGPAVRLSVRRGARPG
jgi:hypothetical protein